MTNEEWRKARRNGLVPARIQPPLGNDAEVIKQLVQ
jgi:hypothetical protein